MFLNTSFSTASLNFSSPQEQFLTSKSFTVLKVIQTTWCKNNLLISSLSSSAFKAVKSFQKLNLISSINFSYAPFTFTLSHV